MRKLSIGNDSVVGLPVFIDVEGRDRVVLAYFVAPSEPIRRSHAATFIAAIEGEDEVERAEIKAREEMRQP